MDEPHICVTCGAQFPAAPAPPSSCPICEDERQYVGHDGQRWTTLGALRRDRRNAVHPIATSLTTIRTEPSFAIGQCAHLIETPAGNLLWNCVNLIDDETVRAVEERGGLTAIAVSHPHFFTGVADWSRAFGGVPVFIHAADREWVTRPDPAIRFWDGETTAPLSGSGLTLIRFRHFADRPQWSVNARVAQRRRARRRGDRPFRQNASATQPWRIWRTGSVGSARAEAVNLPPMTADLIRLLPFDHPHDGWPDGIVAVDARDAIRRSATC